MASVIQICNMALAHLRVSPGINSLTERSQEAGACNLFYEQARDEVLRDFPWPFATRVDGLALVAENPTTEWGYSYRYPVDCLLLRRIVSGVRRVDISRSRVTYRVVSDPTGRLIYTGQPEAVIEYTARVTDPEQYDPDFVQALAFLLAFYIAPRVTNGDQFKLGDRAWGAYRVQLRKAQANALEEEQPDTPPEGELLYARDS